MKRIRFLSVVMAFAMLCYSGTVGVYASAESNNAAFEETLYDLANQYGFEITYVESDNVFKNAEPTIIPVASFDSILKEH